MTTTLTRVSPEHLIETASSGNLSMVQNVDIPPDGVSDDDPYIYGWRYIAEEGADGKHEFICVPLTLEDILHPEVGDFRMHAKDHERFCGYLESAFTTQLSKISGATVLHDVRVDFDIQGVRPLGPDVAVIFNVREEQDWSTFEVAQEGTVPSLVIEVTSPRTRHQDLETKPNLYEQAGVSHYIIVDKLPGKPTRWRLLGYRLISGRYAPIIPNAQGWLWMEPVGLWIGLDGNEVHCYDAAGTVIRNHTELTDALEESETRVEQEAQRAEQEAQRAEQEAQRAEQEAQRAEQESQRAEQEAQRAERFAMKLRALGIDPDTVE